MSHSSLSYSPAADQPARQASPRAQSAAAISRHLSITGTRSHAPDIRSANGLSVRFCTHLKSL